MKNIRQWKTTLISIISYSAAFAYLFIVEDNSTWIFVSLLIFATMMLFAPDSFIGSLASFIKTNEDKKL